MTTWLTRKLATSCAEYGCTRPPLADNCRCEPCRDAHRERNRESAKRRRAIRRAQLVMVGVG